MHDACITPFTRYSRSSNGLYNRTDNRLCTYRVNNHPTINYRTRCFGSDQISTSGHHSYNWSQSAFICHHNRLHGVLLHNPESTVWKKTNKCDLLTFRLRRMHYRDVARLFVRHSNMLNCQHEDEARVYCWHFNWVTLYSNVARITVPRLFCRTTN